MSLSDDEGKNTPPDRKAPLKQEEPSGVYENDEQPEQWGTIYSQGREHALGGVERSRSTNWTPADEQAYLERVKEKASSIATSLIEQARQEAEQVRAQAQQEGYDAGLAQAQGELDEFRSGMADSVSAVLATIEGQCSSIFQQWREDLLAVTRLAVEKITCMEMGGERKAMLEKILVNAVALLEKRRELVIKVNPEDEPVIADIIAFTQEKFPDVKAWRVKADPVIELGGMVIESESSIAESRVESRRLAVEEILSHLTLPGVP